MTASAGIESQPVMGATLQFATFRVAELLLGIELSQIKELMRSQDMARVPLAPTAVEGLINLRGQIVTALDMRRIFGIQPLRNREILPMNIIISAEGGAVSLLVDAICDVVDVPLAASTQLPANLSAGQKGLLKEVYRLKSGLLLVVDLSRVITSCNT